MKHLLLISGVLALLTLACNLTSQQATPSPEPASEKRCGDSVCDGPENAQNCPHDCAAVSVPADGESGGEAQTAEDSTSLPADSELTYGYVYSVVTLDRKAGSGDCGVDPWYSSDCSVMKIWWDMHIQAYASAPVLIIPDGQERWVITNNEDTTGKYGVSLPGGGEYRSIMMNPSVTNPECSGEIEGKPFHFQVMGTRENAFTELILSANPVEHAWGSCMQAGFDWESSHLLFGWAEALSGNPTDLRVELNDTFRELPGQYAFSREIDTNPSPEKRDHVKAELGFICTGSAVGETTAPVPCPWE